MGRPIEPPAAELSDARWEWNAIRLATFSTAPSDSPAGRRYAELRARISAAGCRSLVRVTADDVAAAWDAIDSLDMRAPVERIVASLRVARERRATS